ncbi:hypothetical protein [Metabacillus schmidteae]|uniref:hypothetical protein n=1 Tax=Metabacillus schmidteae TaxID=2730405 RepID=UPI00158A72E5|nr:hypothetical protein [Metabacillus schmidteae]
MFIELIIYMMIGIVFAFYKFKKINKIKVILTVLFWPIVLLDSYIELVQKIKYKNRNR